MKVSQAYNYGSRKAGYVSDGNFQNEALIRVDTVHVNFCENISIATVFLGRGGEGRLVIMN